MKLPTLYDKNIQHEAPLTYEKLQLVYNIVFCSPEAANPRNEVKDQVIELPKLTGGVGYNPECITYAHLTEVYRCLYGAQVDAFTQPQG